MLDIIPGCNPAQCEGKLMMQTWEIGKKTPNFDPSFPWFLPLLDVRHGGKLLSYAISRRTYDSDLIKWRETSFWAWFRPAGLKFGLPNYFFSKIVTILEKANDSVLRKFRDGYTDGWEWFHRWFRCPTNVERPITNFVRNSSETVINERLFGTIFSDKIKSFLMRSKKSKFLIPNNLVICTWSSHSSLRHLNGLSANRFLRLRSWIPPWWFLRQQLPSCSMNRIALLSMYVNRPIPIDPYLLSSK